MRPSTTSTLLRLLTAAVAIVAVAVVASTLPDAVGPAIEGAESGANGDGNGMEDPEEQEPIEQPPAGDGGWTVLTVFVAGFFVVVALGVVWYLLYDHRELLLRALAGFLGVAIAVSFLWVVIQTLDPARFASTPDFEFVNETASIGDGGNGDGDDGVSGDLLVFLLVILTAVAVFLVFAMRRRRRDRDRNETSEVPDLQSAETTKPVSDTPARRDESDPENEVYRHWYELTRSVTKSMPEIARTPDVYTPGEFAMYATDVGFDPDAVTELRSQFESVRYGNRPVSPDVRRRVRELGTQLDIGGHGDPETGDDGVHSERSGARTDAVDEPVGERTDRFDGEDGDGERAKTQSGKPVNHDQNRPEAQDGTEKYDDCGGRS